MRLEILPHPVRSMAAIVVVLMACIVGRPAVHARPPDDARVAVLVAADDARIGAMVAADSASLAGLVSEDLHYAHSNGTVDTKETFLDLIRTGRTKYHAYRPLERAFTFPAEGIAVATGRAALTVENAAGRSDITLSYLAVWRREREAWRFLAWQSARLPASAPSEQKLENVRAK